MAETVSFIHYQTSSFNSFRARFLIVFLFRSFYGPRILRPIHLPHSTPERKIHHRFPPISAFSFSVALGIIMKFALVSRSFFLFACSKIHYKTVPYAVFLPPYPPGYPFVFGWSALVRRGDGSIDYPDYTQKS